MSLLVWFLTLGAGVAPWLSAAAAQSPRPAVCQSGSSLWSAAQHQARRACDGLAKGYANLQARPELSRELARGLRKSAVAEAAKLLEARAEVALGNHTAAHALFSGVDLTNPAAGSALVLHDAAVAASHAGEPRAAASLYRSLSAQRSLLSAPRQARVLLEASVAVMRLGPGSLDEARALLDAADNSAGGRSDGRARKALRRLIDLRSARGLAELAIDPGELSRLLNSPQFDPATPRLPAADVTALMAAVAEQSDPQAARSMWRRYAEAPASTAWRAWLSAHLEQLGGR